MFDQSLVGIVLCLSIFPPNHCFSRSEKRADDFVGLQALVKNRVKII